MSHALAAMTSALSFVDRALAAPTRNRPETVEHLFDAIDVEITDLPGVLITLDLRVRATVEPDVEAQGRYSPGLDGAVDVTLIEVENVRMWVRDNGVTVEIDPRVVLLLEADRCTEIQDAAFAKCGDVERFLRDKVSGR